jgi:hypothetical protein
MDRYDPVRVWDFQLYLLNWLKNADSIRDKFLLLNSLSFFTFFNSEQCDSLYFEALQGPILKWLIEIKSLNILDENINDILNESIESTFLSVATDSTNISTIRHIWDVPIYHTKTWNSYINIDDKEIDKNIKIESCKKDLRDWGYEQIVVLEDFVGSGDQSKDVIDFLGKFYEWKILFIPLIICPQGDKAISEQLRIKQYDHISYEPISKLPWELILDEDRPADSNNPPKLLTDRREYAKKIYQKVAGIDIVNPPWYLGYRNMGSLFAKYTNCPDSTLPLYHDKENGNWTPLFPRSAR